MNKRSLLISLLACLMIPSGCGQMFDLPPQPNPGRIPTPGTYNLDKVWRLNAPTDMVLRGSYIYVIEENQRVNVYLSHQKEPRSPGFVGTFEGLIRPVQICIAKRDTTYVIVADAGDMTIKRYYFLGGPPRFTFADTSWVEFSGLAADPDLDVYVSDAARDRVDKYDAEGRWVRMVSSYGTGQGYVIDPQGLAYSDGALWVSAIGPGRNWVQRLRPDTTYIAFEGRPIGLDIELSTPSDVATNLSGESVFIPETGKNRVMRFQATGAFQDTVYAPTKRETIVDPPLLSPRYLSADDSLVFVADSANNRVVVLRLSKK